MPKNHFSPLTRIGFGAMPLSIQRRPDIDTALATLKTFFQYQGNYIDTANIYGLDTADAGHNERLIQQAIKLYEPQNVIVATKGGGTRPQGGWSFRGGGRPEQLFAACESSLRNLAVSVIDLYFLHGVDPDVPIQESLGALLQLQADGKIKHIGLSNVNLQQLNVAASMTTIAAVQNRMNPFCKQDLHNGVQAFCEANQLLYIPYCPCGGWGDHGDLIDHPVLQGLARKYGVSSYVIMLAWVLSKSSHILPIPGMHAVQQVTDNFQALSLELEAQDKILLDGLPDLYTPAFSEVSLAATKN